MDILCVSDIHGDFEAVKKIGEAAKNYDLVVIAGDLTNFYSHKVAMRMIEDLQADVPNLVIVPGNCDLNETSELYKGLGISLHGAGKVIEDVGFFGVGGSNVTPFNTPLEYEEDDIKSMLEEGYEKVKDCRVKILVSHAPPINTVDKTSSGMSVGSKGIRDFIEEEQVQLVICGHVHEAKGAEKVGDAEVVNTGPAQDGYVKVTVLPKGKVSYEFLEF
jgi:Icc-related predicted phosphoesterase